MFVKYLPLVIAVALVPQTGAASAQKSPLTEATFPNCLINQGTIHQGIVMPGETMVVHGPYTSTCDDRFHDIRIRTLGGALTYMNIEKMEGNGWSLVRTGPSDMQEKLGTGTFRVVIDNQAGATAIRYKGTFSVPL
ncbi:hypothetical protein [Pseudomonas gingeri]|uniref:hypothetical protein n=1 Tax=Pseudomonas gingeri TaxID=117681 RepID=UPI0015A090D4|nr:hypothetical protein [Pseudomonas gingeri]NVZ27199.1 hypothetical protein [Pseudomonas gingeri]NWA07692.1 hypothetical protein [Pseudomonas gingeri]